MWLRDEIINAIGGHFKHAGFLPERNSIWSRPETIGLLEVMIHFAVVKLCRTGCQTRESLPIGKTLKFANSVQFTSNLHSKLSTCECEGYADMNQVNYAETAFYNRKLAWQGSSNQTCSKAVRE